MLHRLAAALAFVAVAGSAFAQFQDGLDPFNKGAVCSSASCTIASGIVGNWTLDEASGTRADSTGNYPLTAVNTPGNIAGKVGNAVTTVLASSQYLVSAASYTPPGDFTMNCWVYLNSKTPIETILQIGNGGTTARIIYRNSVTRFRFSVASSSVDANVLGVPALTTYYMITARFRASDFFMEIATNAGAWTTATGAASPSAGVISIGAEATPGNYTDGRIDQCTLANRRWSDAEVTYAYGPGGSGRTIP
jgi:hypothetical protein